MNSLQGLLYGLSVAATPANLLAAFVGAFAGTAIGVLPGLGPVAGVALILPLTFSLDPTAGLIMMAGIFYGSMYGGSTTAILLNFPASRLPSSPRSTAISSPRRAAPAQR